MMNAFSRQAVNAARTAARAPARNISTSSTGSFSKPAPGAANKGSMPKKPSDSGSLPHSKTPGTGHMPNKPMGSSQTGPTRGPQSKNLYETPFQKNGSRFYSTSTTRSLVSGGMTYRGSHGEQHHGSHHHHHHQGGSGSGRGMRHGAASVDIVRPLSTMASRPTTGHDDDMAGGTDRSRLYQTRRLEEEQRRNTMHEQQVWSHYDLMRRDNERAAESARGALRGTSSMPATPRPSASPASGSPMFGGHRRMVDTGKGSTGAGDFRAPDYGTPRNFYGTHEGGRPRDAGEYIEVEDPRHDAPTDFEAERHDGHYYGPPTPRAGERLAGRFSRRQHFDHDDGEHAGSGGGGMRHGGRHHHGGDSWRQSADHRRRAAGSGSYYEDDEPRGGYASSPRDRSFGQQVEDFERSWRAGARLSGRGGASASAGGMVDQLMQEGGRALGELAKSPRGELMRRDATSAMREGQKTLEAVSSGDLAGGAMHAINALKRGRRSIRQAGDEVADRLADAGERLAQTDGARRASDALTRGASRAFDHIRHGDLSGALNEAGRAAGQMAEGLTSALSSTAMPHDDADKRRMMMREEEGGRERQRDSHYGHRQHDDDDDDRDFARHHEDDRHFEGPDGRASRRRHSSHHYYRHHEDDTGPGGSMLDSFDGQRLRQQLDHALEEGERMGRGMARSASRYLGDLADSEYPSARRLAERVEHGAERLVDGAAEMSERAAGAARRWAERMGDEAQEYFDRHPVRGEEGGHREHAMAQRRAGPRYTYEDADSEFTNDRRMMDADRRHHQRAGFSQLDGRRTSFAPHHADHDSEYSTSLSGESGFRRGAGPMAGANRRFADEQVGDFEGDSGFDHHRRREAFRHFEDEQQHYHRRQLHDDDRDADDWQMMKMTEGNRRKYLDEHRRMDEDGGFHASPDAAGGDRHLLHQQRRDRGMADHRYRHDAAADGRDATAAASHGADKPGVMASVLTSLKEAFTGQATPAADAAHQAANAVRPAAEAVKDSAESLADGARRALSDTAQSLADKADVARAVLKHEVHSIQRDLSSGRKDIGQVAGEVADKMGTVVGKAVQAGREAFDEARHQLVDGAKTDRDGGPPGGAFSRQHHHHDHHHERREGDHHYNRYDTLEGDMDPEDLAARKKLIDPAVIGKPGLSAMDRTSAKRTASPECAKYARPKRLPLGPLDELIHGGVRPQSQDPTDTGSWSMAEVNRRMEAGQNHIAANPKAVPNEHLANATPIWAQRTRAVDHLPRIAQAVVDMASSLTAGSDPKRINREWVENRAETDKLESERKAREAEKASAEALAGRKKADDASSAAATDRQQRQADDGKARSESSGYSSAPRPESHHADAQQRAAFSLGAGRASSSPPNPAADGGASIFGAHPMSVDHHIRSKSSTGAEAQEGRFMSEGQRKAGGMLTGFWPWASNARPMAGHAVDAASSTDRHSAAHHYETEMADAAAPGYQASGRSTSPAAAGGQTHQHYRRPELHSSSTGSTRAASPSSSRTSMAGGQHEDMSSSSRRRDRSSSSSSSSSRYSERYTGEGIITPWVSSSFMGSPLSSPGEFGSAQDWNTISTLSIGKDGVVNQEDVSRLYPPAGVGPNAGGSSPGPEVFADRAPGGQLWSAPLGGRAMARGRRGTAAAAGRRSSSPSSPRKNLATPHGAAAPLPGDQSDTGQKRNLLNNYFRPLSSAERQAAKAVAGDFDSDRVARHADSRNARFTVTPHSSTATELARASEYDGRAHRRAEKLTHSADSALRASVSGLSPRQDSDSMAEFQQGRADLSAQYTGDPQYQQQQQPPPRPTASSHIRQHHQREGFRMPERHGRSGADTSAEEMPYRRLHPPSTPGEWQEDTYRRLADEWTHTERQFGAKADRRQGSDSGGWMKPDDYSYDDLRFSETVRARENTIPLRPDERRM
ncbi:hypothetical protein H696_04378 [Fonticula alba]|uniref:Uncharacterized protein n=1 Tax=Fonticula alba TaxID=691883 RepID=A0A058Z3Y0_FONAL|nr:hypothetical protein H696_04378 [Fonticula alba]KCV68959.1 hypothetical protein H696_04378 [Fonticula alba]|eukprot:XP_009496530.1 hypothetical protein H696_04378 [Fonticula alba]